MSRLIELPKVYPLTDVRITGLSHAEQVSRLADGGASFVQLREKQMSPRDFFSDAKAALKVARDRGVQMIINDRVDLALALGADGVHLGQDDLPPDAARRLLGPKAIIGFSTHNLDQALGALQYPIDYLAIGPIFDTATKVDTDPVLGLDRVKEIRAATGDIPLVAIGGITESNAPQVLKAGANSIALISSLLSDPAKIAVKLRKLLDN